MLNALLGLSICSSHWIPEWIGLALLIYVTTAACCCCHDFLQAGQCTVVLQCSGKQQAQQLWQALKPHALQEAAQTAAAGAASTPDKQEANNTVCTGCRNACNSVTCDGLAQDVRHLLHSIVVFLDALLPVETLWLVQDGQSSIA